MLSTQIGPARPETLRSFIDAMQEHVNNGGTILIGGSPLMIVNFVSDEVPGMLKSLSGLKDHINRYNYNEIHIRPLIS